MSSAARRAEVTYGGGQHLKIVSVVGARPQFIKAAAISQVIRRRHQEILVHTGQHYDDAMSAVFFKELGIPPPDVNLGVGSGTHAAQTAAILTGVENVLLDERPDWVLVYGDTNSTLAGAIAASKLGLRIAHVEAGLRSYNRHMPEEINRVVTDHLSSVLLCPSAQARNNLADEGITQGVHVVGDVMWAALQIAVKAIEANPPSACIDSSPYVLATVHRAENTDVESRLCAVLEAFNAVPDTVLFPVHPRTRRVLAALRYAPPPNVRLLDPVGYKQMVSLERSARLIVTDSGGVQKEAYWLGVPCVTLREETEWVETVDAGWNLLVGTDSARIAEAILSFRCPSDRPMLYDGPLAPDRCITALEATA